MKKSRRGCHRRGCTKPFIPKNGHNIYHIECAALIGRERVIKKHHEEKKKRGGKKSISIPVTSSKFSNSYYNYREQELPYMSPL